MKKFILIILALIVSSCTVNNIDELQEETTNKANWHSNTNRKVLTTAIQYDIFLIAGQSNTHYGQGYDPQIDTSDPDIFQVGRVYPSDNQIIVATEPLQHWTAYPANIGFGLTFAKNYKQYSLKADRKILLIPCGYGGTNIELWEKGMPLYNDAVTRTLKALNDNPGSSLKGILWHQGEYNVGTYNYTTLLDQFISDIRTDLGNAELPIVLGGMVPFWTNQYPIRIAQQDNIKNTPIRVSKTAYADPTVPFVISKPNNYYDDIHYDAAGQRELGVRYYQQYKTLE